MVEALLLLVSSALVNNFVLVKFLGLCPFMGVSQKPETALGMGLATTFVLTVASLCSYLLYRYLLMPLDLTYLKTLTFILIIAVVVQFIEMVMRRLYPMLHSLLGIFLPLITTNCAVLGVALLNVQEARSVFHSLLLGCGAAMGFSLVLLLFATLRERLALADIPTSFRGNPIALLTAGLMSLAFMGFNGWVK